LVECGALGGLRLEDETDEVLGGVGYEHLVGECVGVCFDALVSEGGLRDRVFFMKFGSTHVVFTSLVSNGGLPTSIVYRMTPTLHTSTS
jgi:hypothetical protein